LRWRCGALALLAGLLVAAPFCAPVTEAGARPLRTGVFDPFEFTRDQPQALKRTARAGATFAKGHLAWYIAAPGKPANPADPADPAYSWGAADTFVRRARAAGLEPVLMVSGTPQWARARGSCGAGPACAPSAYQLGQFARAAATRYSGSYQGLPGVHYWQAWSEPNLDYFLVPNSPSTYRRMLAQFTPAVKAAVPGNSVIAGGLAPLARPGAAVGPLRFMRKLLCMRGRAHPRKACGKTAPLDIWATHPYTTGGPTHSGPGRDDVSLGDLPQMTRLLRAADRAKRIQNRSRHTPFWVTEFSWDSRPPDPGGVPLRRQARWTGEALYRMWKAGVSTVFWFMIRDEARHGHSWAASYQSGLYFRGRTLRRDRPKPVLRAFRFPFVALPQGRKRVVVWGRTPDGRRGRVVVQARYRGHGWRKVASLRASRAGIFHRTLRRARPLRMRAKYRGRRSLSFGVHRTRDVYQPPFGGRRLPRPRVAPRAY
jgi:hypothetical protein